MTTAPSTHAVRALLAPSPRREPANAACRNNCMSQLTANLADDVLAACRTNAVAAAAALSRALDGDLTLSVGELAPYPADGTPYGLDGPGLIILVKVAGAALALAMPEESGFLPAWYRAPDAAGASKLSTLAQELSLLVLPDTLAVEEFAAAGVDDVAESLARSGVAPDAVTATLKITSGESTAQATLIWPITAPSALLAPSAGTNAGSDGDSYLVGSLPTSAGQLRDFAQLPSYSRSLLKIRVPVSVNLAAKREIVQEVVELVPGSIIKFEKGCDELLHMIVGGQTIAEGEAVKIGDKFGFRVTAMLMPEEHFIPVRRPQAS
jgi:flagellar motor switch protein FliN/FliY